MWYDEDHFVEVVELGCLLIKSMRSTTFDSDHEYILWYVNFVGENEYNAFLVSSKSLHYNVNHISRVGSSKVVLL